MNSTNRHLGYLYIYVFTFILIFLFLISSPNAALVDRSKPNIAKNLNWNLDHKSSKFVLKNNFKAISIIGKKGSGYNFFTSSIYKVKPNQQYTCLVDFKGDAWPSTSLRLSMSFLNKNGIKISNSSSASTWTYREDEISNWREAIIIFKTPKNTHKAYFLMSRYEDSSPDSLTWMKELVYCHEGNYWTAGPSQKEAFKSSFINVTSDGIFIVDNEPVFLRCAFLDNNNPNKDRWREISKAGFNCNMWAASLKQVKASVENGFPYVFLSISPVFHKKSNPIQQGWAYKDFNWLNKFITEVLKSPFSKNIVGYYFDDEAITQQELIEQVVEIIDTLDRDSNGKRQRPMYFLEGNPGRALQHMKNMDIVGSYIGGDTGGEGSGPNSHLVLHYANGFNKPVVFAQSNRPSPITVNRIKSVFNLGATAIGYWKFKRTDNLNEGIYRSWFSSFSETISVLENQLKLKFDNYKLNKNGNNDTNIPDEIEDTCDCLSNEIIYKKLNLLLLKIKQKEDIENEIKNIENEINTLIKGKF